MNLARIIDAQPDADCALITTEERISYGQLRSRVAAMRQHLAQRGVGLDDRVVISAGNEPDFVVAILATMGLGAIAAPVNPYGPVAEFERKLEALAPAAIVIGACTVSLLEEQDRFGAPVIDMRSVERVASSTPLIVDVDPSAIAILLSTSGVAGAPKVAMLSHRSLAFVQEAIVGDGPQQLGPSDIGLGVLPFAHVLGLNLVLFATLRAGGAVVLQARFDADASLELIRTHGVTSLVGAPPMWQRWATSGAPADSMQSVRFARSGAASLRPDVHNQIKSRYGVEVCQGYGLTETSSVLTTGRGLDLRVTSVGKPIEGATLVLVDDNGEPVEDGEIGEVVVQGEGVFSGYFGDDAATSAILTDDGWLWTGDLGVFDDDGYLYLVDRIKDIVIVSGFNVYPAEVEDVLVQHHDVRAAVVVGEPHGETGETVVAHVSGAVDLDELDRFVRGQLSSYKCPTEYRVTDELPATDTGKKVRRGLSR